tara:strand:+ start:936 stop:1133 length:198 start_codon:yes stop_codon:yes gene_type:complete
MIQAMRKSNLKVNIVELDKTILISVRSKDSDGSVWGEKAHRFLIAPEFEMAMLILMTFFYSPGDG